MKLLSTELSFRTTRGLLEITQKVDQWIKSTEISDGVVLVFCKHTSCSLTLNENADPSAKRDLECFLDRLAPENQSWHEHTFEGQDDSPSHMKTSLTQSSLTLPISNGQLELGTWQGLYLWEHRDMPHTRYLTLKAWGV